MRKIFFAAAMIAAAAACGKKEQPVPPSPAEAQAAQPAPSKNGQAKAPQAYKRTDAYFRLPSASGGEIDLASYAGRPVLLMFFTETCPFCRKAAPFIESVNKKYSDRGLAVIGIDQHELNPCSRTTFPAWRHRKSPSMSRARNERPSPGLARRRFLPCPTTPGSPAIRKVRHCIKR